jgi:TrpR family trp operon transcriptional repressor
MMNKNNFTRDIAGVLAGLKNRQTIVQFLDALLTPPEKARIGLRWRLVCLLADGVPQREIARRLGISLCKITRGSRELKSRPVFRNIVVANKKYQVKDKGK